MKLSRTKYHCLIVSLLLLLAQVSYASKAENDISYILDASGVVDEFGYTFSELEDSFRLTIKQSAKLTQLQKDELYSWLDTDFNADRVTKAAVDFLAKKLDRKEIESLKTWYASPTGLKISKIEIENHGSEMKPEVESFVYDPKKQRHIIELAKLALELHDVVESQSVQFMSAGIAMFRISQLLEGQDANSPPDEMLEAMLKPRISDIGKSIEPDFIKQTVFDLKDLSKKEVAAYKDLISSEASRKYHQGSQRVLFDEMHKAIDDFRVHISKILMQSPGSSS